ncbi:hypothetical protein KR222_007607, partial [Zaprionus bogoriensis]
KVAILSLLLLQLKLTAGAGGERVLDRCTLAREMDALGVPRSDLARWVFLAEDSNGFHTDLISKPDVHGVRRWGLFQMNDKNWCKSKFHKSQNICKKDCEKLLGSDIKDAVKCALIAKHEQGWLPWPRHTHYLFAHPESIEDCFT